MTVEKFLYQDGEISFQWKVSIRRVCLSMSEISVFSKLVVHCLLSVGHVWRNFSIGLSMFTREEGVRGKMG